MESGQHFTRSRHAELVTPESVLRELEGLRSLARSLVRGDAEADDLVQDTAVAAITHPPVADRPVRPWLATVLRNRWRMNRRSEARRRAREDATFESRETAPGEDPIDRARVLERLSAALVALDEPFRGTVIRRYLDGQSAAEIARALGIPAGTVRWRLKTGLERLRAALDETTPRWKRALLPLAAGAGKGAVLVKGKTGILALVALVLLLGVGAIILAKRHGSAPDAAVATTGSGSGSARARAALPVGGAAVGNSTTPAPVIVDPLPGQGRATIEAVTAPGGAVSGRVINWSTGEGVAGAELTFSGEAGATTIRSAEGGAFELAPAAPGRFELMAVVASGYLPYAPELAHSPVGISLAKDRAVRGLTVFLFPAVDYHGVVVDATGKRIAGARVRLLGTPAGEQTIEKLPTEWTSDKDGEFLFHAADDAVFEATRGKQRGWARLDSKVALTKVLVIPLGDDAARDATIQGIAVDETGAPLADVLVRADPDGPPGKSAEDVRATAFATSGPDGAFTLTGVNRGMYALAAELEGRAPTFVRPAVAGGTSGVKIQMLVGEEIAGHVETTGGEPVGAYTLLVLRREGAVRMTMLAESIVDPRGAFRVRVPPGDYELVAASSGLAPSAPAPATAGAKDVRIALGVGAVLRGKVVDASGSGPLQYARVMREARGGGASATPANAGTVTRADGTFELTGIPPGPVAISIAGGGYHPKVEAGMTATEGGEIGPLTIALTKLAPGEQPSLELVGIGVALAPEGDSLRVDKVYPESGAAAAGIVAQDHVVAVDGIPVTTLGLDGAVAKIRGVAGTTVSIAVKRGDNVVTLVVERKKLRV